MPTENQSNTVLAPRPGKEFWDKLNALPRYMFLLKPSDAGVQKLEDRTGNWIDVHEAQKVVDQAQEEINQLRAERDALQLRLNAADQRIDELVSALTRIHVRCEAFADDERDMRVTSVEVMRDIATRALGQDPAETERDQGIPGTSFQRLNMLANQGE